MDKLLQGALIAVIILGSGYLVYSFVSPTLNTPIYPLVSLTPNVPRVDENELEEQATALADLHGVLFYRKGGSTTEGGDIWKYNPETGEQSKVTNLGNVDKVVSISPDSKYIIITITDSLVVPKFYEARLLNVEDKSLQELPITISFGTGGTDDLIAWVDSRTFRIREGITIYEVDIVDGSKDKIFGLDVEEDFGRYLLGHFAGHGSHYAYSREGPGGARPIKVVNLENKEVVEVPGGTHLAGADGESVYTATGSYGNLVVYRYDLNDKGIDVLLNNESTEFRGQHVRSINGLGTIIAVSTDIEGDESSTIDGYRYPRNEIYVVEDGNISSLLVTGANEYVTQLNISRDNTLIAYRQSVEVRVIDLNNNEQNNLCPNSYCSYPVWQP